MIHLLVLPHTVCDSFKQHLNIDSDGALSEPSVVNTFVHHVIKTNQF